jgi:hypothetical protein
MPQPATANQPYNLIKWINDNHYWELIAPTGESTFNCRGVGRCVHGEHCIYDEFLEAMNPPIWHDTESIN